MSKGIFEHGHGNYEVTVAGVIYRFPIETEARAFAERTARGNNERVSVVLTARGERPDYIATYAPSGSELAA